MLEVESHVMVGFVTSVEFSVVVSCLCVLWHICLCHKILELKSGVGEILGTITCHIKTTIIENIHSSKLQARRSSTFYSNIKTITAMEHNKILKRIMSGTE